MLIRREAMKKKLIAALMLILLMCIATGTAYAATYYISPEGNDSFSGTSEETPWKSLEKVTATTFLPGDEILFKTGGVWYGQLYPKGNGEEGNPITIGSYGDGAKPVINGNSCEGYQLGGAVSLYNQSWWTIKDIEITNMGEGYKWRMGLSIYCDGQSGEGYVIKNVTVHDVAGSGKGTATQDNDNHWNGGIVVRAEAVMKTDECRVDNVTIEDCTVHDVKRSGILVISNWNSPIALTDPSFGHNVTIRNNTLYNIWGDGIIAVGMDGGVVEHNVAYETNLMSYTNEQPSVNVGIWAIHSKNLVYRFNESYLCRTTLDGYGYDIDGDNQNITFEYNYSHDNDGGFMLLVNHRNENFTVRYNISQNDHQFQLACPHFTSAHPTYWNVTGKIYNNTFYAKEPGQKKSILMLGRPRMIEVYNNLFYVEAEEVNEIPVDYPYNVKRHNNFYYWGNSKNVLRIDEENAIVGVDPKLVGAGTGELGWDTVDGYKLFEDSPCIGAGVLIEDNGGRDYFGNPVSDTEAPNIGAYGGPGVSYQDTESIEIAKKRDIHVRIGENTVTIKGESVPADSRDTNAAPFIKDGSTMVPLRTIATALGMEVEWHFETRKTTVKGIGVDMEFSEADTTYRSGSETKTWSTIPVSVNGILYVPVRDLCNEAGEIALWDNGEVHITDNVRVYTQQ